MNYREWDERYPYTHEVKAVLNEYLRGVVGDDNEPLNEFQVGNLLNLQRWLNNTIDNFIIDHEPAD